MSNSLNLYKAIDDSIHLLLLEIHNNWAEIIQRKEFDYDIEKRNLDDLFYNKLSEIKDSQNKILETLNSLYFKNLEQFKFEWEQLKTRIEHSFEIIEENIDRYRPGGTHYDLHELNSLNSVLKIQLSNFEKNINEFIPCHSEKNIFESKETILKDFFPKDFEVSKIEMIKEEFQNEKGQKLACLIYILQEKKKLISIQYNSKTKGRKTFVKLINAKASMQAISKCFEPNKNTLINIDENTSDVYKSTLTSIDKLLEN